MVRKRQGPDTMEAVGPRNPLVAPGRNRAASKTEKTTRPAEGPSAPGPGVVAEAVDRVFSDHLLLELLDASLSLPSDQLDREIERCLRRICELFDLDRCLVWQFLEWEPGALRLTHVPQSPGDPPALRDADPGRPSDTSLLSESTETPPMLLRTDAKVFFPWLTQQLKEGTSVVLPRVEDVPADAAHDRETFAAYHTRSLVAVPLMSGRTALGAMSFATVRAHRDWSELEVRWFRLIAHVLGLTLANRRPAMALDRTEARLALAADSAEIGLWMLEPTSGQFWASDRARHLFGYGADTQITMASFLDTVQPEDRERTREAVRRALEAGQEVDVEYRIVRPDQSVRWIRSRGRVWASASGESPCLLGVSTDVTERKENEEAQAEHLRFETLLSDLSSNSSTFPPTSSTARSSTPSDGCASASASTCPRCGSGSRTAPAPTPSPTCTDVMRGRRPRTGWRLASTSPGASTSSQPGRSSCSRPSTRRLRRRLATRRSGGTTASRRP